MCAFQWHRGSVFAESGTFLLVAAGSFSPAVPGSPPKVRLLPGSRGPRLGQWQPRIAGTCGQWEARIRGGRATAAAACGRATAAVSDSAALHQAAAAPRPARSAPQVSCCLGPAPLLPPGPAAAQSPGHPLAVQSVARFQPRHRHSSPLSLARVGARVVSNPSPSDRFILTPGNAPPPPRHTRKTLLLGSAGCLPATAIFSLVPRLPYWPQTELLC